MSKAREYCASNPTVSYWSGLGGFEIHGCEWEDGDPYIYAVSNAWGSSKSYRYHRLKVHTAPRSNFVRCYGYKIPLVDCLRMDGGF